MSEEIVVFLKEHLNPHLTYDSNRNFALSCQCGGEMFLNLHMPETSFLHLTGDAHGVGKTTVCRTLHRFVETVNNVLFNNVVCFPNNWENLMQKYFAITGIPSVCARIDGSLISIHKPCENEFQFVD